MGIIFAHETIHETLYGFYPVSGMHRTSVIVLRLVQKKPDGKGATPRHPKAGAVFSGACTSEKREQTCSL
jgi:hypothetical protein